MRAFFAQRSLKLENVLHFSERLLWPLATVLAVTASFWISPAQAEQHCQEIPLFIRIGQCEEGFALPRATLDRMVQLANQLYKPYGICFAGTVDTIPTRCELVTRQQRDDLYSFVNPVGITVLVVKRIQDLDLPSYDLKGVHWRVKYTPKHRNVVRHFRWIYLTARAESYVLAHELGHYFGLAHDPRGGNLMTPGPSSPLWNDPTRNIQPFEPKLTDEQARKIRRFLKQEANSSLFRRR